MSIKNTETLAKFLKEDARLVVPTFQRPYAWKGDEVNELFDDIVECKGQVGKGLYLGSFILDMSKFEEAKTIEIVDGQQRLTTLFLLLIACREHARAIKSFDQITTSQNFISFIDDVKGTTTKMRLQVAPNIRPIFEYMANSAWDGVSFPDDLGKRPIDKVKPTYDFFRKQLKEYDAEQLAQFRETVHNTRILRIDIDSKEDAFSIFERTNERGKRLEVEDLLKNYLYQYQDNIQDVDDLGQYWDAIIKSAGSSMTRMLKAYYVSQKGYVQKPELFKKIKKYSEKLGVGSFAADLKEYAEFNAYVNNIGIDREVTKAYLKQAKLKGLYGNEERFTELHRSLVALKFFRVRQTQPLVYAAFRAVKRLGKADDSTAAKAVVRMVKGLEAYHFVNTFISTSIGNEVEKIYADWCDKTHSALEKSVEKDNERLTFSNCKDIVTMVDVILAGLRKKRVSKEVFEAGFVAKTYDDKPAIYYIFDRINRVGQKGAEAKEMFYPDESVAKKAHDIEHICANAYNKRQTDSHQVKQIDSVGNLSVMSHYLNKSLDDKSPEEKGKLLRGKLATRAASYPEVQKLATLYLAEGVSWDDDAILKRAKDLAMYSYTVAWNF